MSGKPLCVLVFWTGALLAASPIVAEELRPARQLMPQNAVLVVELSEPKALLDLALSPQVSGAITALPPAQKAMAQQGFQQFTRLVQYLENKLSTDWRTLAGKLLGGGVTLAALPQKSFLAVLDTTDAAVLNEIQQVVVQLTEADAINNGRPSVLTSREVNGTKVWTANRRLAYAILGRRLVAASNEELLTAALARGVKSEGSLDALPAYRAARQAIGPGAGMAWLNLAQLRQLGVGGSKGLGRVNPMMVLLAGGALEAARDAEWAAARLRVEGSQLTLDALFDVPAKAQADLPAYAWPAETRQGALENLSVPRQIGAASLYRDLQTFYKSKDQLFPERSGGLVFFENMMGIFFSGRDLADEVLSEARPEIRFVVSEQQYPAAKPALVIPAFAAVFQVKHPEQFGEVMEAAWQKALGLVNITRGQKAQPGLIIDRPMHAGTQFSMAYFPAMPGEDTQQAAMRFNFRPALVRMGPWFILSSSDGLAKDLIDALKKDGSATRPVPGTSTQVDVNLATVASLLAANRAPLVRKNMLEKAVSQEEAESRIDMLVGLVNRLDRASFTLGRNANQIRASLNVKLK
jgi:hypothetical protein